MGIILSLCELVVACNETDNLISFFKLASSSILCGIPAVEIVICLAPNFFIFGSLKIFTLCITFSKFKSGSSIPIYTKLFISILLSFSIANNCPTISPTDKFLTKPLFPVEQNAHFKGQPTWVEIHAIVLEG